MGRRQKKLPNANQPQLLPKGYHPAKKVVISCSSQRSISLCSQDYQSRSALAPLLNHQNRIKVSSHLDHKTLAISSPSPKLGAEPAQLPQALQQAGIMPRHQCNYQATTTPSTGTTVLSLPCPDSWVRVPVPSFPSPDYQVALPLGSNQHVEAPSIPDHFLKLPSDSDHLPMISQGCDHWAEDQSCPDHKLKTPPVPPLNHNYQSTDAPLQQTPTSQGIRTRPKITTSLERYLSHWHRAIFSPLSCSEWSGATTSDSDHWVKGTTARTSCPDHYLRTKTTLLQHPEHNPWVLRASASSCCNQQVRATAVPPPCPNHRETTTTFAPFQSPDIPPKNPSGLHFEVRDTTISSVQHDHQDIPLPNLSDNTEGSMIVSNHWTQVVQNRDPPCNSEYLAKAPLDPEHWPMVLPHLDCWTTILQPALDRTVFKYIDNQTKSPLGPEHKPVTSPSIDPVCAKGLSPLKYWATPLSDSKQEVEVPSDPNQWATTPTVPNQWLGIVSGTWQEVSVSCNHWAQAPLDTCQQVEIASDLNHWDNAALESDCRVMTPQNSNCQDQIPPDTDYQVDIVSSVLKHHDNTIMLLDHRVMAPPDIDEQVELESDPIHWGKATVDPEHNVTGLLGPDNQSLTPLDTGIQNEDITDLEHQNETIIVQDIITNPLPVSCDWVESIPDPKHQITSPNLDYETKTQIDFNHNIMDAPGHDHVVMLPIISEDAEPSLDLNYEFKAVPDPESMDILTPDTLDHRSETEEVPDCRALLPQTSDYQNENSSDCNDQDGDVIRLPSSDFEGIHPLDLNNVGEIPLRINHQSKMTLDFDHQTKVTLDNPNQVILSSSLDQDAEITLDSDNCDEVPSFSQHQTMLPPNNPKPRKTLSYSDNREVVSPNQNHRAMRLNTKSQTVAPAEPNCQTLQRPCHWAEVPLDSKHRMTHHQSTSHKLTPPSRLKSLAEEHFDLDHQTKIAPNCKHQLKWQPFMNNWSRTPSNPNPLTENGKNREPPWCLTYIKPYTIEGGNIPHRTVNNIIRSIPQEKIKNDIYKQILLERVTDCSNFETGLCLTSAYVVCLICASWIPYGCPHVQEMKDPCKAQLLSISSLLPGSKEEMSVKFVLQVPQLEAGSIFTVRYPDYGISGHLYHKSGKSFHSQPSPSKLMTFLQESSSKLTWLDFIRGKSYQPYGKNLSGSQHSLLEKMHINCTTREEGTRGSEKVFKSLLERFQKKRSAN